MSNTIEEPKKSMRRRVVEKATEFLLPKPYDESGGKVRVLVVGEYGVLKKPKYYPFDQNKVIIKRGGQGKGPGWTPEYDEGCFVRQRKGLIKKRLKNTMLVVKAGAPKCVNFQRDTTAPAITPEQARKIFKWLLDENLFSGIKNAMRNPVAGPILWIILGLLAFNVLVGLGLIG